MIGVAVYTGHETKVMLNSMVPSIKRSKVNIYIYIVVVVYVYVYVSVY